MRASRLTCLSRLAEFYERAGYVKTLNGTEGSRHDHRRCLARRAPTSPSLSPRTPSASPAASGRWISPWPMPATIPAINWNDSYSEYVGDLGGWYYDNVGHDFMTCREQLCAILLLQENNLMEIVKLIGADVLPDDQKLDHRDRPRHPRRLPAAERFPRRGYLCAAGKAAEDDGNHSVSVRQVRTRSSPSRCRSAVCWLPACLTSWCKMKYDRAQRRLDQCWTIAARSHRCQARPP